MTAGVSSQHSSMIPVGCIPHRGSRGFAILMVEKRGQEIVLQAQVSGGCTIIFDEVGARALFDVFRRWLG